MPQDALSWRNSDARTTFYPGWHLRWIGCRGGRALAGHWSSFVAAILHYQQPDDALKIISGLSGIVGVITGAFVSYFFTRGPTQTAESAAKTAHDTATLATRTATSASTDQRAFRDVVAHLDSAQIEDLKAKSSALREALRP